MYYDWDDYLLDCEYEAFREETGHITNFDEGRLWYHELAVKEYNELKGEVVMVIGEASNAWCEHGLYCLDFGDLTEFWRIVDRIKKEGQ